MLQDNTEASVMLMKGITLDLNGNKLTVDAIVAFNGINVVDNSAEKGILVVNGGNIVLAKYNLHMAVHTGEGYVFGKMIMNQRLEKQTENTLEFKMKPFFVDGPTSKKLFSDGAADNRINIGVVLTWVSTDGTTTEQIFTFTDDLFSQYYTAGTLVVNIAGIEGLAQVDVHTTVTSDTGVVAYGASLLS